MTSLVEKLARVTRMARSDVEYIAETAFRRYKVYTILKRDGVGRRIIAHPARELKAVQRALVSLSPPKLVVHPSAKAYEKGSSILKNAEAHKDATWVARFDMSNFFNSIKSEHWIEFLRSMSCDQEYLDMSSKVFFWRPSGANSTCLSVGAPSSPFVSNRFMYRFDKVVAEYCLRQDMIFTRYADDMIISSQSRIDVLEMEGVIRGAFPYGGMFKLNNKKTRLAGIGHRRAITGLILNADGQITLGRDRKRQIEAMIHAYAFGRAEVSASVIRGHLSFLKMIDHASFVRLRDKYSSRVDLF